MNLLKQLTLLLMLFGFIAPAYAAVADVDLSACSVFSEGDDKKDGDKKEEEEEPDCE